MKYTVSSLKVFVRWTLSTLLAWAVHVKLRAQRCSGCSEPSSPRTCERGFPTSHNTLWTYASWTLSYSTRPLCLECSHFSSRSSLDRPWCPPLTCPDQSDSLCGGCGVAAFSPECFRSASSWILTALMPTLLQFYIWENKVAKKKWRNFPRSHSKQGRERSGIQTLAYLSIIIRSGFPSYPDIVTVKTMDMISKARMTEKFFLKLRTFNITYWQIIR